MEITIKIDERQATVGTAPATDHENGPPATPGGQPTKAIVAGVNALGAIPIHDAGGPSPELLAVIAASQSVGRRRSDEDHDSARGENVPPQRPAPDGSKPRARKSATGPRPATAQRARGRANS